MRPNADMVKDFPDAHEGVDDFGDEGYGGPCPPPGGPHLNKRP